MTRCPASGSTNSYRITLPGTRVLVCAECSADFPQVGESMRLPLHITSPALRTRDEIITTYTS